MGSAYLLADLFGTVCVRPSLRSQPHVWRSWWLRAKGFGSDHSIAGTSNASAWTADNASLLPENPWKRKSWKRWHSVVATCPSSSCELARARPAWQGGETKEDAATEGTKQCNARTPERGLPSKRDL